MRDADDMGVGSYVVQTLPGKSLYILVWDLNDACTYYNYAIVTAQLNLNSSWE